MSQTRVAGYRTKIATFLEGVMFSFLVANLAMDVVGLIDVALEQANLAPYYVLHTGECAGPIGDVGKAAFHLAFWSFCLIVSLRIARILRLNCLTVTLTYLPFLLVALALHTWAIDVDAIASSPAPDC